MFVEREGIKRQAKLIFERHTDIPQNLQVYTDAVIKICQVQNTLAPSIGNYKIFSSSDFTIDSSYINIRLMEQGKMMVHKLEHLTDLLIVLQEKDIKNRIDFRKVYSKIADSDAITAMNEIKYKNILIFAGIILEATKLNIPVILDGSASTISLLIASKFEPKSFEICIASSYRATIERDNFTDSLNSEDEFDEGAQQTSLIMYDHIKSAVINFNNLISQNDINQNEMSRIPFPIGTTSNIEKADILDNVENLKNQFDDIELTLFESRDNSCYPPKFIIRDLVQIAKDSNLSYTVHLPYDVNIGSLDTQERDIAMNNYLKMIERVEPLPIHGYVIHLVYDENNKERSLFYIKKGMEELIERSHVPSTAFCVETLFQPFDDLLNIVKELNLSVTLDIGHLVKNNFYSDSLISTLLPFTRIIHFHGCTEDEENGKIKRRAHQSIATYSRDFLENLYQILHKNSYLPIVFTIEVFDKSYLEESVSELNIQPQKY
ncbi:MAG: cobamide remodeling phosphodiesterase CbiR [Sphaerochaeta sp.]